VKELRTTIEQIRDGSRVEQLDEKLRNTQGLLNKRGVYYYEWFFVISLFSLFGLHNKITIIIVKRCFVSQYNRCFFQ